MEKLTARSAKWRQSVGANIESASGKSVDAWCKLARRAGVNRDETTARAWLRKEQGLTIVQTAFVLDSLFPEAGGGEDARLDAQFAGPKAALRPIYDKLAKLAGTLGKDVMIAPRKTQVTFARDVTFATVRAATSARIDLALRLPATKATARLVANPKAAGSDPTHVVTLASVAEVDADVKSWMKLAYTNASRPPSARATAERRGRASVRQAGSATRSAHAKNTA